jgi:transketolase N-terminal domain/subunit/transketolase C-terminal domain/subunit
MMQPSGPSHPAAALQRAAVLRQSDLVRDGLLRLLRVKDSDIRRLILEQCRDAVDKSLHAGGALSATVPLVALYYGGFLRYDAGDPARPGQDLFVLSKGHAVAALAAIYAELGYIDAETLVDSRSYRSVLNGHPGPLLPGVPIATGPMGQGVGVAQGFAIAGRMSPRFDVYALTGDGELQEGPVWEAVMYAGQAHLDNLCVLVDRNHGQLDVHTRTVFPMPDLAAVFESFGWMTESVDATDYDGVYSALERFRFGPRTGRPTAVICESTKGHGGFSEFFNRHKVTVPDALLEQELALQAEDRRRRVDDATAYLDALHGSPEGEAVRQLLLDAARDMRLDLREIPGAGWSCATVVGPRVTTRVAPREKRIAYDPALLPVLDRARPYSAADIVTAGMKVFARDRRVVSIDADLASTSGLEGGVAGVDQRRALNVGVAEANMMLIGEAFAALGHNVWVSTFCPFFDWKVLRRIAVGHQERLESIASAVGWLSHGHGLDLTFLATAANFETRTNGATHMGNDDSTTFQAVGHLRIIDVACPQQLLSIMQWIMEGNRGLVYLRVMRTPSSVLYDADYRFEFGRADVLRPLPGAAAVVISSGRQVHESLAAADLCATTGVAVGVVDMSSVDEDMMVRLAESQATLVFAEQNDGYLLDQFLKTLYRRRLSTDVLPRVLSINTLGPDGRPWFIHSATYEELIDVYGLAPAKLADRICRWVAGGART